jgi:hypothetical protein
MEVTLHSIAARIKHAFIEAPVIETPPLVGPGLPSLAHPQIAPVHDFHAGMKILAYAFMPMPAINT